MKKSLLTYLLYAFCGALCAVPYVKGELWVLSWIAFVPVLICELIREKDSKHPYLKAWKRGFCFFYFYGLVLFHWFIELYPLDFAGFDPITAVAVVLLAWLGIPLLQSITSSFVIVLLCFYSRKIKQQYIYPVFAACLWVISEWIHTLTWIGLPWGRLAIGQVKNLNNIQIASLLGSYFVAFIIIVTAGFLALSIVNILKKANIKKAIAFFAVAVMVFSSNNIYGGIMLETENNGHKVTAAAIQGNFSTDKKWDEESEDIFEIHQTLSLDAASEGAKLIVWSETALPYRINIVKWIDEYAENITKKADASLIIGCFESVDNDFYNITKYVSKEGGMTDTTYAKRRLVPFGEFVPMRDFICAVFPFLDEIAMLESDITAGNDSALFETEYGKVGSLICFDSLYEELARDSVRDGAQLLCISTNDSWFGDSAALYQHNAQAILRSIETGRYTVRAANTGVSSIITNKGEIVDMMPPLTRGYALGTVEFIRKNTLYTNVGNILVYISIAFTAAIFALYSVKDKINGHSNR